MIPSNISKIFRSLFFYPRCSCGFRLQKNKTTYIRDDGCVGGRRRQKQHEHPATTL